MTDVSEKLKWFREHLLSDILPRWFAHAPTQNGLFFTHFDRAWERRDRDVCTLVSQTRLLYNFSVGYRLTGGSEYLDAVNNGADALLRCFRDKEHGGWYLSCNMDGEMREPNKDLYGHAFAIFGLTHAASVTERDDLKKAALDTWNTVDSRFRDSNGGFFWRMTPDFQPVSQTLSQNPVMHLFEALFALSHLDDTGAVRRAGEGVGNFVVNRLIRRSDGVLPELYDSDWRELSEEDGGRIDVGHSFEWSYLLSRAAEAGWPRDYLNPAKKLLENGLRLGFDASDGGILSPVTPDGKRKAAVKGWWEQCEAIRALMHFAVVRGDSEALEPMDKVITFIRKNFVDEEYGGWFSRPTSIAGERASLNKGSEWKVDYHVVGMCAEAIRLSDRVPVE